MRSQSASESIECPLCNGAGKLSRAEILDRLGVKDFARVAQLSAEEAFLQKNSALAEEVRRTFVDLDEVEQELRKAAKSIQTMSGMTLRYRVRLQALCDTAASAKIAPKPERDGGSRETFGA